MRLASKGLSKLSTILFSSYMLLGIHNSAQALSFAGKSQGEWGMPVTPSPTSVISISSHNGGTNNRITWGTAGMGSFSNYVQFNGASFDTTENNIFKIGDLFYRNGSTFVETNFDGDFPLGLALSLTLPLESKETFSFLFNILNTENTTGDPVLDGDRLRFSTAGVTSHTFNYQDVDYTLQLIGFSTDGGETILSEFNSPENSIAKASLYGKITAAPNPSSIPEPASLAGLSLVFFYLARQKRK